MSEFPLYEAALVRAAHRRYGWRRWRPRVVLAVAAAALAGVVLLVARPAPPDDERAATPRWTTVAVPRYGVDVSLPEGWKLASASLTPHLLDPHEILTAATFTPVPRASGCSHFPSARLGSGDALVSVQERARAAAFAPRPRRFTPVPISPITTRIVQQCVLSPATVSYEEFSDGLRNFHALVVLDPRASPAVRVQAYAILDRLRFDPRFVPWW